MTAHASRLPRDGIVAGLAGSALAHGAAVALLLLGAQEVQIRGTVYAVNLVAAPSTPAPRRAAAEAVPRPVTRTAPIKAPRKAAPVPPAPTRSVPQRNTEAAAQTASPATPMPGETPSTGADVANVQTPGQEFPFPEYLRHVLNEIYRRWPRPTGPSSLRTEVTFLILRDGTVREITVASRSRSFSFDLGARGAVEAAANARAFRPLPEGFQSEVLAISLWFQPRTGP
jgi:outer membrane biosynthesis protein TonB